MPFARRLSLCRQPFALSRFSIALAPSAPSTFPQVELAQAVVVLAQLGEHHGRHKPQPALGRPRARPPRPPRPGSGRSRLPHATIAAKSLGWAPTEVERVVVNLMPMASTAAAFPMASRAAALNLTMGRAPAELR